MPIPTASDSPDDRTALEPIRVLRPRNTDALAQLLDEIRQDEHYRGPATDASHPQTSVETEQLPSAPGHRTERLPAHDGNSRSPRPEDRPRLGPGQRRAAVTIAIAAAAVAGLGGSLLIPSPTTATPAASSASASAAPTSAAPTSAAPTAVGRTSAVLANPGFESGGISPWHCADNPGSIVASPVHGGSKALEGTVSSRDTAQCDQTVEVEPNTAYSLSGWVRGSYVYLGVSGGTSTWTTSPSRYSPLTVSFTTGPSQTSATLYVHGWYAQGSYHADDIALKQAG